MVFVASRSKPLCSYCNGELGVSTSPFCRECGVSIHLDCWDSFGGCATAFCVESPKFESTLESQPQRDAYAEGFTSPSLACPDCNLKRVGIFCARCGLDYVAWEIQESHGVRGRPAAELLSDAAKAVKQEPSPLVRTSLFLKLNHCPNCGLILSKLRQCKGCLYEP